MKDYEPTLHRLVDELGLNDRVRFLGNLESAEMPTFFAAVDVFCVASSREGWPNALHEALACGVPAVAARVGSVPSLLPSEKFGLIPPSTDSAGLTPVLSRALSIDWDREAISKWGRSRSWANVAHDVLLHLRSALQDRVESRSRLEANENFRNHSGV